MNFTSDSWARYRSPPGTGCDWKMGPLQSGTTETVTHPNSTRRNGLTDGSLWAVSELPLLVLAPRCLTPAMF